VEVSVRPNLTDTNKRGRERRKGERKASRKKLKEL